MALPSSISFLDIETTGLSSTFNRIIEIGILRVEDNKLVREFKSLVNPGTYVDPFIEEMTGINSKELEGAPSFYEIKDELLEILEGSVFVAHNVRFDYGFIRNAFKNVGVKFSSKHFCSVKLARYLYPDLPRYGLDSIITNFNIDIKNRHRAYDDAKVVWDFYQIAHKQFGEEKLSDAVEAVMKKTTLPSLLPADRVNNLPESPGVYIFYGESGMPIYIGKSVNIQNRVMSHFSNDHLTRTDMKISQQAIDLEIIPTAGELGALLLESRLVKERQPLYNRQLRDVRKMIILLRKKNSDGFNTIEYKELNKVQVEDINKIVGVFRSRRKLNDYLFEVSEAYYVCPKLLGIDKSKKSCFNYHLGKCMGTCIGMDNVLAHNIRFDEGFYNKRIRPWKFDKPILIKEENELKEYHVVDKWCYLGSIKNESEDLNELSKDYLFDYDTYKILNRYIMNPKNQKYIKLLS